MASSSESSTTNCRGGGTSTIYSPCPEIGSTTIVLHTTGGGASFDAPAFKCCVRKDCAGARFRAPAIHRWWPCARQPSPGSDFVISPSSARGSCSQHRRIHRVCRRHWVQEGLRHLIRVAAFIVHNCGRTDIHF